MKKLIFVFAAFVAVSCGSNVEPTTESNDSVTTDTLVDTLVTDTIDSIQ